VQSQLHYIGYAWLEIFGRGSLGQIGLHNGSLHEKVENHWS